MSRSNGGILKKDGIKRNRMAIFTTTMKKEQSIDFNIKIAWHAISRMYSQYGQDFEISPSSGFVLLNIDVEKGTPATKIAPLMGLEARSLTRILKALEQKKWIIRKKDPLDGRLVRIFLTKKGREKRAFSSGSVKAFNKHILHKITEGELQSFLKVTAIVNEIASDKERIQEELQQLRNPKE